MLAFVFKFLALLEMASFRKEMETNEAEILSEVFDDNSSDVPSENEDADDSFEDCEEDSSDSEIITPVKKSKLAVFSSDSNTDENNDNCWSENDILRRLQMFEGHPGVTTFPFQCDSVTNLFFGEELFEMFCKELCSYHDQTAMRRKTPSRTLKWSPVTPKDMKKFLGLIILMSQTKKDNCKDYWSTEPLYLHKQ
ncbi:uncharacterized protein LOC124428617 [Vespa crabro]|uniref:uncharacterized protein LOC124428617 n=1 Tax=Vespa crabro TaxID=7445 RepID=UPI001EFFBF4F|nr:uncharacterized protein LOC124428617 [Vespa crabro]